MQQDYQTDPSADPNADAIRQSLLTRMGQRSPNTGVNGGVDFNNATFGPNTPAPPQPGPGATPPSPPAPPAPAHVQPFDHSVFRDSWLATGNNVGAQDEILKRYGITLDAAGRGTTGDGAYMDLRRGAGAGDNTAQFMGLGQTGANGQVSMYAPAGGGASTGAAGGGGGAFQDQIRQMLLQTMSAAGKPVDANDPQITAEMDAQRRVLDRQAQQQRASNAERAAFQGTLNGGQSSGSFDADLNGIQENEGQQLTGLQSQLFSRVAQQKQAQLQQALSLAVQSGDAESARAIQFQIAQMDAQIKQQSLSQQQSQFNDNYGLNLNDAQYQRDRDAARAKAGLPF